MSYYQILDRPAGTFGYQQGAGEQLGGVAGEIMKGVQKGQNDAIFRKALAGGQMEPEFTVDENGKTKITYKPKKAASATDLKNKLGMALAGFTNMSSVPGLENTPAASPFTMPTTEGGKAGTPPGATAKDGQYFDAQGNVIGEYDPTIGPGTKDTGAMDSAIREALKQSVGGDEYKRAALGLKAPEKSIEQKATEKAVFDKTVEEIKGPKPAYTVAQAINILSDPMKAMTLKKSYPDQYAQLENLVLKSGQPAHETFDVKKAFASPNTPALNVADDGKTKSPFPDYPDAFMEGGAWKVMRNGQKMRIINK